MYNNTYVKCGSLIGTMVDIMFKWIIYCGVDVDDNKKYGNYTNLEAQANLLGYSWKLLTEDIVNTGKIKMFIFWLEILYSFIVSFF